MLFLVLIESMGMTMEENKRENIRLTIERQLEQFQTKDVHHAERYEILWHSWNNNKRWLAQLLQITISSFPSYSKHDESHAATVLTNIEMILGEERIAELSATDCFMILHTVYIHDIGMVITHTDREQIVQNDKFLEMVEKLNHENDFVFQKAIKALRQTKYDYSEKDTKEEAMKQLYSDKLKVYYALLHLIANYRRTEHGDFSEKRLTEWTMESDKLGAGFSMAGIPQRIFMHIAKCAGIHTKNGFQSVMKLPQEDNGYVGDYIHPRFVAVLLQLGDILDMDNDRFHPLFRECIGALPEMSERHYEKHQSIRQLYIRPDIIAIEADCNSQEALRLVRKECDMLKEILQEAGYNWTLICPRKFSGSLPTISSVKLSLNGVSIPEELVTAQFSISQKKAFSILEGGNVYQNKFVFLREFLQNAIDASKIQYWTEYLGSKKYSHKTENLRSMSPNEMDRVFSTENFPIQIEMEVVKRDEEYREFPVTEADKEELLHNSKNWEYGVKVKIRDFGTGINKESILSIAEVGSSRRRERDIINVMPEWLKPTAEFGIGLQSAFILADTFKCETFLRGGEKYEITFSSVKSAYYEGYINVRPLEKKDAYYGTCFEIFIPEKKKLSHELYPLTWDGKDYFDEDYDILRPIRHSVELMAQMAMYLDSQIGEQLFPVELKIIQNVLVEVPINTTEKNRMHHLKCNLNEYEKVEDKILDNFIDYYGKSLTKFEEIWELCKEDVKPIFEKRKWTESGLSWIFYPNVTKYVENKKVDEIKDTGILIEKNEKVIAMLDCWEGSFYLWEKELCILCTINMKNFLLMEQKEKESTDEHCERNSHGVVIYYKGILMDEIEFPDLGNEMIESIDIKGKLLREYINLNRRGFTEKGKAYFHEKIYRKLLDSIYEALQSIDKNQGNKLISMVRTALDNKLKLMRKVSERLNFLIENQVENKYNLSYSVRNQNLVEICENIKNRLLIKMKESVITLTMLGFFAQKEDFVPQLSQIMEEQSEQCWSEMIEVISKYAKEIADEFDGSSILFHIEVCPRVFISGKSGNSISGNLSRGIDFTDIFLKNNQFMIISKRENIYAPWKQFLIPIWEKNDWKSESFVEIYKEYVVAGEGRRKKEIYDILQKMGKNALEVGRRYDRDLAGSTQRNSTGNYLQQYFFKWMTRYIPTVAMFMSEDGNTRVNFIYGKSFPCIFVNDAYKELVIRRVIEYANKYDMQRFSIPAWQNTEMISCNNLPYVLYFVKRGYASQEALNKVIFPLDKVLLSEIQKMINSEEALDKKEFLNKIFSFMDVRSYLKSLFSEEDLWKKYIDEMDKIVGKAVSEEKKEQYLKACNEFKEHWRAGDRRTDKILMGMVNVYRDFVTQMILDISEKTRQRKLRLIDSSEFNAEKITMKNFSDATEVKWKQCMAYMIIEIIVNNYYNGESTGMLKILPKKYGSMVAQWWDYIIEKRYIQDTSLVLQLKEQYIQEMENEENSIYRTNKRIVEYISVKSHSMINSKYIWQYWKQNVNDIFEIVISIELGKFYNPETILPDLNYIKEKIK